MNVFINQELHNTPSTVDSLADSTAFNCDSLLVCLEIRVNLSFLDSKFFGTHFKVLPNSRSHGIFSHFYNNVFFRLTLIYLSIIKSFHPYFKSS